ncbi:hypothetical protein CYMTET_2996 [Cymbomonas tetramitiformis]|uniref:Uncharacterized protein n=1 Tax=Cymbomonas tetramitiformis TaxID=36881 RepID=A0AAE0H465_9CHLO|nr:hypothetical protein CYMTET_2996 [Cymbomonas tetramitiformis]
MGLGKFSTSVKNLGNSECSTSSSEAVKSMPDANDVPMAVNESAIIDTFVSECAESHKTVAATCSSEETIDVESSDPLLQLMNSVSGANDMPIATDESIILDTLLSKSPGAVAATCSSEETIDMETSHSLPQATEPVAHMNDVPGTIDTFIIPESDASKRVETVETPLLPSHKKTTTELNSEDDALRASNGRKNNASHKEVDKLASPSEETEVLRLSENNNLTGISTHHTKKPHVEKVAPQARSLSILEGVGRDVKVSKSAVHSERGPEIAQPSCRRKEGQHKDFSNDNSAFLTRSRDLLEIRDVRAEDSKSTMSSFEGGAPSHIEKEVEACGEETQPVAKDTKVTKDCVSVQTSHTRPIYASDSHQNTATQPETSERTDDCSNTTKDSTENKDRRTHVRTSSENDGENEACSTDFSVYSCHDIEENESKMISSSSTKTNDDSTTEMDDLERMCDIGEGRCTDDSSAVLSKTPEALPDCEDAVACKPPHDDAEASDSDISSAWSHEDEDDIEET